MSSSFQEAVFQNNVIIRNIIDNLVDYGSINLLYIALINKKFYQEICSRLQQIQSLHFYCNKEEFIINNIEKSDSEEEQKPIIHFGFNQILCNDLPTFNTNLSFVTKQSPITSLNVQELKDYDWLRLDPLLQLKGIQSLTFHPSQRNTTNTIYLSLIDKNLTSLKTLIHPPEDFFKSLLSDTCINLDYLEIDIGVFRTMQNGVCDGESVYIFEAQEKFKDILQNKLKAKHLCLYGHNCHRFQPFHQILLAESNVSVLKMICNPNEMLNDDLLFIQEWKNRNKRFLQVYDFELIFWDNVLKTNYDTAIPLIFDVFPKLTRLMLGSQKSYSADECLEVIEDIQKYWKKNSHQKCQHYVNLKCSIPKEQQKNFELRLINHKSYRSIRRTCKLCFFTMRINIEDNIFITFQFT